jgi:hypothetical protein
MSLFLSTESSVSTEGERFECEECGSHFESKKKLQRHALNVHIQPKRGNCPICHLEFDLFKPLGLHIEEEHIKPTIIEDFCMDES